MTRGRWIALGVAALAVLLIVWVARNTYFEVRTEPRPPRGEARTTPFYAAQKLVLELGGFPSWGPALGELPADGLVVVGFLHWGLLPSRQQALEQWVENGGRLVVDHQLLRVDAFSAWSGLAWQEPPRETAEDVERTDGDDPPAGDDDGRAARCQPITGGRQQFSVCQYGFPGWLRSRSRPTWTLSDGTNIQALRVQRGKGSIAAINATPFATDALFEGDHAKLFVALAQLRRGDVVRFIAENERPSLLALVWRHGWPVVLLAAGWLAIGLWRRGSRFGPIAPDAAAVRRSLAEQIRGTGHFILRVGGGDVLHEATRRALLSLARARISGFAQLTPEDQAAAIARGTAIDAAALAAALGANARRTGELRHAIATLEDARRQLLTRSTTPTHGTH